MMLSYKFKGRSETVREKITISHYCDTTHGGFWHLSLFVCWKVYLQWFKIIKRELKDQRQWRFFTILKRRLTSNLSNCGGRCFWYQLDHDIGFQTSTWLMMICFSCWTIKNYLSNILQCCINPRHNKNPPYVGFFHDNIFSSLKQRLCWLLWKPVSSCIFMKSLLDKINLFVNTHGLIIICRQNEIISLFSKKELSSYCWYWTLIY